MGEISSVSLARPPEIAESYRVLIVDDHPIVRYGIVKLLEEHLGMQVAAETSNCEHAWELLISYQPDVLLMDGGLKDGCAHKLVNRVTTTVLATRVLIYSAHSHDWHVTEALRNGAHGFINKDAEPEQFCMAIRAVADSGYYIDAAIASKVIGLLGRKDERREKSSQHLTPREADVLNGIALGKRNCDIARDLFITERTVKYHLSSLFNKLGVRNRTEAVKFAMDNGLVR